MRGQNELRRAGATFVVVLAVALFNLLLGAPSARAEAPYEPNDSVASPAGPLQAGQSYGAAIETAGDRDYYSFYVTSATPVQVSLSVQNLGGDNQVSGIDAAILDSAATPIAAQAFIRDGESQVVSAQLEPQKYFVEVSASEGFGDSYLLSPSGGAGAFGPFAEISSRCASAMSIGRRAGRRLGRARSRLQRTTARVHRSRYGGPGARRGAAAAQREARRLVRTRRGALRRAHLSAQPWCSIAQ